MSFKLTIIILAVFRCEFVPSNQQKSSKIRLSSVQQESLFQLTRGGLVFFENSRRSAEPA
jgi:hypothetical protein